MITNKENWLEQAMIKVDSNLVEIYMRDYCLSEYEARKCLAEMFYSGLFEIKDDKNNKGVVGYLQY
jgi:hypothetical protein